MIFRIKASKPFAIVIGIAFLATQAFAIDQASLELLNIIQKEEPELFERVELVEENDRELLKVTLADVLRMVLKRSTTIEALRLGEQASQAGLVSTEDMYSPTLTTSATQAKTSTKSSFSSSSSPYLTTTSTDSTTLSTTLSKKSSSGITYSSTLSSTSSKSTAYTMSEKGDSLTDGGAGDTADTTSLSASISVPIFQDWGEINDLAIRRSELGVEGAKVSTYSTGISLLESVAKTYWTLVGVQENIMTLQEAVELSEQLVQETAARVEVGVLNPTDLKEAETQLATNQQSLLNKKIEEQEIEDQIRVALDLSSLPFGFKPADFPRIHGEDFNFEELLEKTYSASDTLQNLNISLASNQYDLEDALNDDKTDLDLSVSYTLSGYGGSAPDSVQTFSNQEFHGYSVGLTWTAPLFDKTTPETIKKRRIERSQLEMQIRDTKSQLYISLQTKLRNLKFGIKEKKTAELSVNLAKDLLDKEVEKLKIGKSTSYNVSQAQQKYLDAKLSETLVRVSNEQNFVTLLTLTGDIFDYYKIEKSI